MNIDTLAGLRAAAESALESSFLKNRSHGPAGEKRLLFNPIEVGDVSAEHVLRRKAVSIYTLVTTGDDSLKVRGEDRVLQLVQNAGRQNGLKNGLTGPGRAIASSAPSYGFRRSLR